MARDPAGQRARRGADRVGGGRLHHALRMVAGNDAEQMRDWQYAIEEAGEPLHFPSLAEIAETLPPVRWLWHGWIPRGMVSLLGVPGHRKSYFVLDLARTIIEGGPWPTGSRWSRSGM